MSEIRSCGLKDRAIEVISREDDGSFPDDAVVRVRILPDNSTGLTALGLVLDATGLDSLIADLQEARKLAGA